MTLTSCSGTSVRSSSPVPRLQRGEEEAADRGQHRVEGREQSAATSRSRPCPGRPRRRRRSGTSPPARADVPASPHSAPLTRHRDEDHAAHRDAADSAKSVEPGHPHRVAERRAAEEPRHRQRQHDHDHDAEVSGVGRVRSAGAARPAAPRSGRPSATAPVAQRIRGEVGREQRSDVVEQQGGHHQWHAEPHLRPRRQQRPRSARGRARQHRSDQVEGAGSPASACPPPRWRARRRSSAPRRRG